MSSDKLAALLSRVKNKVRLAELSASEAERRKTDLEIAQDYALRLAERAKIRRLLSEQEIDGLRFRWYFERFGGESLDATRAWIDSQMLASSQEKQRA